jgi:endo-1,4-beta-xylanase
MDAIFKKLGKFHFGACADSGSLNQASNAAVIKVDFRKVAPENRCIIFLALISLRVLT